MAAEVRRRAGYMTYGNAAVDPAYVPQREREAEPEVAPRIRQRDRVRSRARVLVRQPGYVSPTAVIGFAMVAVLAVLVLLCHVRLTAAGNDVVRLREESALLKEEQSKLLSDYELAFDLKTVEEIATTQEGMIQPLPGQEVTLDVAQPDSAQIFTPEQNPLAGLWESVTGAVRNIVEFFG